MKAEHPTAVLVRSSEVPILLDQIRPSWQANNLIHRVHRLLEVDPSSACQRLLNAAIHDLKEKVTIAGLDIAAEAAEQWKLPPIRTADDLESYSTAKVIDLAYRMGLLSRPEWRRVCRCYEIRRDLEHEDDEYEAGIEDCVYIFKTCIEAVLAKDPIHLLRVTDIKDAIEQPEPVFPAESLLEDYGRAPQPRQEEILRFLFSNALDKDKSEVVQQNAYRLLAAFESATHNNVKLNLVAHLQQKISRVGLDDRIARVAHVSGLLPYLKQAHLTDYFGSVLERLNRVGSNWRAHKAHGDVLRTLREVGGLLYCPIAIRQKILLWLVKCYLGEPGGTTMWGNFRPVYYSVSPRPTPSRRALSA